MTVLHCPKELLKHESVIEELLGDEIHLYVETLSRLRSAYCNVSSELDSRGQLKEELGRIRKIRCFR
jgi:hypothetical protein